MRGALDALYQELDREDATDAPSRGLIKEKVKVCVDKSQSAFQKIRMERMCFQDQINELTREKLELEKKVETLEQGIYNYSYRSDSCNLCHFGKYLYYATGLR